jgi:hypothetical protein
VKWIETFGYVAEGITPEELIMNFQLDRELQEIKTFWGYT